jgi:hypothetical protein
MMAITSISPGNREENQTFYKFTTKVFKEEC